MAKMVIEHAHVISPKSDIAGASVVIEDGIIRAVLPPGSPMPQDGARYDAGGAYLVPGFIDIHTHGAAGKDVTDPDDDAVETVARAKLQEGCTSFAPTTLTLDEQTLRTSVEHVAAYKEAGEKYKIGRAHV